MTQIFLIAAIYMVTVNLITWLLLRHDRNLAVRGHRRVPELGLLTLAALGGALVAKRVHRLGHHPFLRPPTWNFIDRVSYWYRRFSVLGVCVGAIALAQIYLTSGR